MTYKMQRDKQWQVFKIQGIWENKTTTIKLITVKSLFKTSINSGMILLRNFKTDVLK